MTRLKADLALLLAAAVWGSGFYFQKMGMEHIGPVTFVAARAVVASLILVPLALWETRQDSPRLPRRFLRIGIAGGLVFFVAGIVHQMGVAGTSVTNAGFLTALYVIFTPFLGWVAFRRWPVPYVWPAVALALAGVWLLGGSALSGFAPGDWLIVLSAVFWAGQIVLISMAASHGRPIALTAIQFVVVAVLAAVAAPLMEDIDPAALLAAAPDILYVGALSSALTYTLFALALRYTSAGEGAVLLSTETLFAALMGAIFMGDRLTVAGWCGAGLMFAATLVVHLGPAVRHRPLPAEPPA